MGLQILCPVKAVLEQMLEGLMGEVMGQEVGRRLSLNLQIEMLEILGSKVLVQKHGFEVEERGQLGLIEVGRFELFGNLKQLTLGLE